MSRVALEALRDKILAMPASDQLRVAAGLIDKGKSEIAEPIVRAVADQLTVMRLFGKPRANGKDVSA